MKDFKHMWHFLPHSYHLKYVLVLSLFIGGHACTKETTSSMETLNLTNLDSKSDMLIDPNLTTNLDMETTDLDFLSSEELDVSPPDMMDDLSDMTIVSQMELPLNKSPKRGIAYGFNQAADFTALSSGISWWYNWSPSPNSSVVELRDENQVDWVPMTWNGNNPNEIRAYLDEHPEVKYLLTFNEPNFTDQANLTPAYAASIWPIFEEIAEEYDLELVGPAVNYCGGCVEVNGVPIDSPFTVWMDMFLDEFNAQFGRPPRMDYTALHWYDYGLEDQVDEMVLRYGKPLWLTEFALWRWEDWCTDEVEREWLLEMVDFLEAHPYVFRYAWFTGRRPDFPKIDLLGNEGELTPLGEAYVNAPYYVPIPKK